MSSEGIDRQMEASSLTARQALSSKSVFFPRLAGCGCSSKLVHLGEPSLSPPKTFHANVNMLRLFPSISVCFPAFRDDCKER